MGKKGRKFYFENNSKFIRLLNNSIDKDKLKEKKICYEPVRGQKVSNV